jgi:hypothetical protein
MKTTKVATAGTGLRDRCEPSAKLTGATLDGQKREAFSSLGWQLYDPTNLVRWHQEHGRVMTSAELLAMVRK